MSGAPRAPIRRLPERVAAQIAAGEVIERPASVVKELLENALDAGASRIAVTVEGAGLTLIRVSDDGCGIAAAELPLAFERHATSKLRTLEETQGLRSYGFRGEALPSIAAAATVDCLSRLRSEEGGWRLQLRDGRAGAPAPAAAAPGTTLEVRDLFARQPARRKFLPGTRAERAAIARVCGEAALARPAVAIALEVDGRAALRSGGEGERRAAFGAVWGGEIAAAAIAFAGERPPDEAGAAALRVEGLAAPPPHHRARRGGVALFVNGRPVQAGRLAYAVEGAYGELLPTGRFPIAACFLEVPGERLDVNVHPAKAQVRLADEGAAFGLIQRTLWAALVEAMGALALRGAVGVGLGTFSPGAGRAAPVAPALGRPALHPPAPAALALERREDDGDAATARPFPNLPLLRVVGQVGAAFVVAEGADGVYVIDQHAAHERVLYERLLGAREADGEAAPPRQPLLDPPLLELSAPQAAALERYEGALAGLGYGLEPFGERALRVRSVPACLAARDARSEIGAVLDDLAGAERTPVHHNAAAAVTACHAAVRAGQRLGDEEMRALLRDLERCGAPHTCPHGRPTLMHLPTAELERQFGRR